MSSFFQKENLIKYLLQGAASTSIFIVLLIVLFLGKEAIPFFSEPGISNLFGTTWKPVSFKEELFGILPLISGTVVVTIVAMFIAVPTGVIGAAYLSQVAHEKEREILKPFMELLAGIPSVVIGFFGLIILAPIVKELFGLQTGLSALTGSILLALMAIPTIMTISDDAISSVPRSYKEASLSLGASKFYTLWKVTVPAAMPGIVAAVLLGMGRVIGETMAVMMVTGNAANLTLSPFESVRTMTATIAAEMGEVPFGSEHYSALFMVGLVLMFMTFGLVLIGQRYLQRQEN
ncbi:MAG: phosphate ABC transporter permease subunit PstC [Candidatus Marinimicrobia bacterium]|nr:phosphate ABC transporter permease subunit PstC [Candidatus Neomarinimicrobiota bacterium]